MNFIKEYINWAEIWDKEVDVQSSIDNLDEIIDQEIRDVLIRFKKDTSVIINIDECYVTEDNTLLFCFSESGGQNESDNQGWSRMYQLDVGSEFMIISAEYEQG